MWIMGYVKLSIGVARKRRREAYSWNILLNVTVPSEVGFSMDG
jgi:hypothetical protein